jgi:hypothetical protein
MEELEVPAPRAGVDRTRFGVDAANRALTGFRHGNASIGCMRYRVIG